MDRSSVKKAKREKTMTISAGGNPKAADVLPIAICWNHALGTDANESQGSESSRNLTVENYIPGKTGKPEVDLRKRHKEEENLNAGLQKDPFQKLITAPTRKGYAGSLTCRVRKMDFEGLSHPTMSASTVLGIYDPSSNEIKLVPFGDIFTHMKIKRSAEVDQEKSREESPIPSTSKVSSFSSRAKRRRHDEHVSSAQSVRQDTDRLLDHEGLDDISELLNNASNEGEVDLRSGEGIRPTPCLEATTPQELYRWHEIMPDHVITDLLPVAEEISEIIDSSFEEWKSKKAYSQFTLRLLKLLPRDIPDRRTRIAQILMTEYLFCMFNKPTKPLPENSFLPKTVPETVANYFKKEYTTASKTAAKQRMISIKGKHKILAHLLLTVLHLEDFASDVTALLADMPGKERKIFQHLTSIIGGRFSESYQKSGDKFSVTLKHPWNFPKSLTGTPRKKRR